ncbi:hypothetical protein WR25_16361 [Diploscapter pachys]|uniref:Uncharacterized protein n=1 Tax=Diploscapter pachys TaxID=2018661 RepID=A0A2A2LBA6_9BILA|nr:hypothetical protein WR25_16361 [Diploscapter pachys]
MGTRSPAVGSAVPMHGGISPKVEVATPNSDHYWQNVNLSTPTTAPSTFSSYSDSTNKTKQPAARRRLNLNETSNFSHFNDDMQMHNIYQQPQQHNYPPVESGNLMHCLPRGIAPTFSPAHGTNKRVGKRKAPKSEPSEDGGNFLSLLFIQGVSSLSPYFIF